MFFQFAALLILAIFYGCYIAKMMLQKKNGIHTDQMGKGKSGMPRALEAAMKAITYLTVAIEVVSILWNTAPLPIWLRSLGLVIASTGLFFFALAIRTMRNNWRAGVPSTDKTELVTEGIFRYSRNPAFLGFDLVYLGILLLFFNPVLCTVSIAAALLLHLQITYNEEPFLRIVFGEAYMEYSAHVYRYLGRRK